MVVHTLFVYTSDTLTAHHTLILVYPSTMQTLRTDTCTLYAVRGTKVDGVIIESGTITDTAHAGRLIHGVEVTSDLQTVIGAHNSITLMKKKASDQPQWLRDKHSEWLKRLTLNFSASTLLSDAKMLRSAMWIRYTTDDANEHASDIMPLRSILQFWSGDVRGNNILQVMDDPDLEASEVHLLSMLSDTGLYSPLELVSGQEYFGTKTVGDIRWAGRTLDNMSGVYYMDNVVKGQEIDAWDMPEKATVLDRTLQQTMHQSNCFGRENAMYHKYRAIIDGKVYNSLVAHFNLMHVQLQAKASYYGSCVHELCTVYVMSYIDAQNPTTGFAYPTLAEIPTHKQHLVLLTKSTAEYPLICKVTALACVLHIFTVKGTDGVVRRRNDATIRWVGSDLPMPAPGCLLKGGKMYGIYADLIWIHGQTLDIYELKTRWTRLDRDLLRRPGAGEKAKLLINFAQTVAEGLTVANTLHVGGGYPRFNGADCDGRAPRCYRDGPHSHSWSQRDFGIGPAACTSAQNDRMHTAHAAI